MNYEKPKIIMRRVAYAKSVEARSCLGCGKVLCPVLLPFMERLKCPVCDTINQVKLTDHGTVILTDEAYADQFLHEDGIAHIWMREEEKDE